MQIEPVLVPPAANVPQDYRNRHTDEEAQPYHLTRLW